MSTPGRNDPCPCASGKKFKRCCGAAAGGVSGTGSASAVDDPVLPHPETAAIHRLDHELTERAIKLVLRRHRDEMTAAMAHLPFSPSHPDANELLGPCAAYLVSICGKTPAEHLLAYEGARLSARDRGWLEANVATPLSLWEVRSVEPGAALVLRDRLTGEERRVIERKASCTMTPLVTLCARVVTEGERSLMIGMHPNGLYPWDAEEVVKAARKRIGARTKLVPRESLLGPTGLVVLQLWCDAVAARNRRPVPRMVNGDGDVLVMTEDRFTFAPSARREVIDSLATLDGFEADGGTAEATAGEVVFHVVSGKKPAHSMSNRTSLGTAHVGLDVLRVTTTSTRRADALRARVEAACGSLLRHTNRDARDAQDFVASSAGRPRPASPPIPPEAQAMARAMMDAQRARWPDEHVPALGGLTPREAAMKPAIRATLVALLKDLELRESRMPAWQRTDFAALRHELGLEE